MKIKLHFPAAGISAIKALGQRQINPETLRWTTDHHESHYGMGVILRGTGAVCSWVGLNPRREAEAKRLPR